MKKKISLGKDPQLTLVKQYKRKRLDPLLSLEEAIAQADSLGVARHEGGYKEREYRKRANDKLQHPKDLTLRELAYIAIQLEIKLETLIGNIHDGFTPQTVENVKAVTYLQGEKIKEFKFRIREFIDEGKEYRKRIIELENERDRLVEVGVRGGRNSKEDSKYDWTHKEATESKSSKANSRSEHKMEDKERSANGEVQPNGNTPSGDNGRTETEVRITASEDETVGSYKGPLSGNYRN